MKVSIDARVHTHCSLSQAAALRDAFGVFAEHAMAAGLDIRRALTCEPHPDEAETWRDYASRDITSAVDEVSPLSTRGATAVVPPGKIPAPKARRS